MQKLIWLVALVAACGSSKSNNTADAPKGSGSDSGSNATSCNLGSGSGSATAPSTITISGSAVAPGLTGDTAVVGATIAAYPSTDPIGSGSAVASTTTGADGVYSLTVPTGGVALDGFVLATDGSNYIPTYLWPPAPLAADYAGANIKLL